MRAFALWALLIDILGHKRRRASARWGLCWSLFHPRHRGLDDQPSKLCPWLWTCVSLVQYSLAALIFCATRRGPKRRSRPDRGIVVARLVWVDAFRFVGPRLYMLSWRISACAATEMVCETSRVATSRSRSRAGSYNPHDTRLCCMLASHAVNQAPQKTASPSARSEWQHALGAACTCRLA